MPLSISIPRRSFLAPSAPATAVTDGRVVNGHADPVRPPLSSAHAHSSRGHGHYHAAGHAIPPVPVLPSSAQLPPGTAAIFARHLDHPLNGHRRSYSRGNSPTRAMTPGAGHAISTLEELFMNLKHRCGAFLPPLHSITDIHSG